MREGRHCEQARVRGKEDRPAGGSAWNKGGWALSKRRIDSCGKLWRERKKQKNDGSPWKNVFLEAKTAVFISMQSEGRNCAWK